LALSGGSYFYRHGCSKMSVRLTLLIDVIKLSFRIRK